MADLILRQFTRNELELVIDTQTGECYASQSALARMCGCDERSIRRWVTSAGIDQKQAKVPTTTGFKTAALLDENAIYEALAKYNPPMLVQCAKIGLRAYLHSEAGFEVTSSAVQPQKAARLEDYDNDEVRVEVANGNKTLSSLCKDQGVPYPQPHIDRARGLGYIKGHTTKPLQDEAGQRDWISAADRQSKLLMALCNEMAIISGDVTNMDEIARLQRETFTKATGKTPRDQLHFPKGQPALATSKRRVAKKQLQPASNGQLSLMS
jgi:hypothetical protein